MVVNTIPTIRMGGEDERPDIIVTNDGVDLSVVDQGTGPAFVLVPGWSQSAAEFRGQVAHFSRTRRVIALDHRGHGRSSRPESGYRLARLAADLHDVLAAKHLDEVDVLAHSMGCAVVWAYWNLFGRSRIRSLVLVDQPATMTASPLDPPDEVARLGSSLTPEAVAGFVSALVGPSGDALTQQTVASMFTPGIDPEELDWVVQQNLQTPRGIAATLFYDEALADWRDVIPTITVPTLVLGGELSLFPPAGPQWVADHIPGSRLRIFTAEENGSHFVFWESPDIFNRVVEEFLDAVSPASSRY